MHKTDLLAAFHKDRMPHHDIDAEIETMHQTANFERRCYNHAKFLVDHCPHNADGTVSPETLKAFEALQEFHRLGVAALNVTTGSG